jgi:hypothetical protein
VAISGSEPAEREEARAATLVSKRRQWKIRIGILCLAYSCGVDNVDV